MQQDGKVTPSKERKSIATNVLRNPAAKVAVASTLVGSIGIAGGLEVFLPGEEQQKVEAAVHGDFEYIISNGAVTITGYTGASYLHPVIPSYIGGYPVRVIGESAFEEDYLGQVTIPNTVTTIESRAFYSSALDAINIPSSVTTIGEYAFHGNLLKSLTIPSSVKTIGTFAFASNNIQNLTIPGTLKVVEGFAFYNNEMKTLTISNGVTDIGMYAFLYNELTEVTIPSTVKSIQDGAFASNKIVTANIPSAATTLGEGVFESNQAVSTNLNITGADPSPAKMYALNNAHKFNGKILDVTPPSIILTPNKTAMTNENITVSANITDSASAVSVKKWAAGNQSVGYFASNGTVLDSSFVATSNGTYTVYAKDAAGNEAVQTITINNIDRVAPIPATFSPSTTAPTKEDISLTINYPNDSAIKQYSINDGTWETYMGPLTISNNGTVKARSMDSANNTSEESSISITNIDRVAPNAPTLSASTTAPTNGQVEITITYPEDTSTKQYSLNGGSWENYTNPIVMTSNGTVKARGIDAAGNISNENSIDVTNIDDVPPANATFHASTLEPTNEDVTVTITYPEDALLKEYKLGTGGTWTTYTNPIVLSSNTTVYARSKDEASNYSEETSLAINNIDKTPPANATFTLSNDQPTNNNVSVTIDYPNDSIVKQFKVGEDGVWTNYTVPVILSENNTIFARSQDAVGNWSNETNIVITNIDKIAPTKPTITADKSTTTNLDVKVSITYSSDTKVKEYRLNGGEWLTYSGPITILENKLVEARGQDAAGNTSEIASIEINNIDKVKPEITLTPTSLNPVNTEIEIDVKILDNNPIIEKKWAKGNQDESYFLKAGTNITDNTFNVSENGTYTVYTKDSAGNVSLKTIDISNIDKEAPVIKLTPSTNTPINKEINVNVEVTDNNQIIEKKWAIGNQNKSYFSKSGTNLEGSTFSVKENGTYTVYAKDSAGNETIQTISISNIDKEGPVITLTPSTIDPINTEINVDIKLEDNNPILIKKWAKGNQNVSFFSTGGTDVLNNKFTVTENDIYTVYAKDSAGNETVQTIDITNIDKVAPKAPILEVSSTATTNKDVTVTISYPADAVVKEYKIGSGDWQPYVGQIVIGNNETVYARGKDEAGNWSVESSIDVTNIDKEAPGNRTLVFQLLK
ncbi:leucine-rich repeat protein [Cytobacillus praedii]|uniref:leucine-rich repeat protein n=1 Tax=Cytobacillus praedii TaxID=1742358 RepID=UPI002E1EFD05|nr:leucine-rich repeat protein [Cytobacillus praedii]